MKKLRTVPYLHSGDKMKFRDIFKSSPFDGGIFSRCKHYFYDMPTALPFGQWEIWDAETKKKHPISWFFLSTIPRFFRHRWHPIKETYYHLRSKYIRKHHYIKIDVDRFFVGMGWHSDKPLRNYHWIDSDVKLLFANFQILVDFVEKERDIVDWQSDAQHQETYKEFMELYTWWTKERPLRPDAYPKSEDYGLEDSDIFGPKINQKNPAYKRWLEAIDSEDQKEEEYDNEDTEMLIRLITIRKSLWT